MTAYNVKIALLRKCTRIHCWDHVILQQNKKVVVISNWNFIKLKMSWNQNYFKTNKQRLYYKLIYTNKYTYYPFSSEYQLHYFT